MENYPPAGFLAVGLLDILLHFVKFTLMALSKTAQQGLFKELTRAEIQYHQEPLYNNHRKEDLGEFKVHLEALYANFESELNDNLTDGSPSLEIYLNDIYKKINKISDQVVSYRKEEIHETMKHTPEIFKQNQLGYMNHFLNFQLEIIEKTEAEIQTKLELVRDKELFRPDNSAPATTGNILVLQKKLKGKVSKVNLTVFLWWATEAGILDFEDSHDYFVKFLEENVQYYDKSKKIPADMKDIGSLMAKMIKSNEANPITIRQELLELLQNTPLPPIPITNSKLKKNKWSK